MPLYLPYMLFALFLFFLRSYPRAHPNLIDTLFLGGGVYQ